MSECRVNDSKRSVRVGIPVLVCDASLCALLEQMLITCECG